ncbi:MAG: hypothetical protein JSW60_02675 [Thermoplasmatales archaeon]|nr:MAG: hypothetical protein JSW60_02675 [Thermoplasmatales archaeon]
MRKKVILGRKENDPEWIKDVAFYVKSGKADTYKEQLRELFLEYTREGLDAKEAWEKAKRVLASFEIKR